MRRWTSFTRRWANSTRSQRSTSPPRDVWDNRSKLPSLRKVSWASSLITRQTRTPMESPTLWASQTPMSSNLRRESCHMSWLKRNLLHSIERSWKAMSRSIMLTKAPNAIDHQAVAMELFHPVKLRKRDPCSITKQSRSDLWLTFWELFSTS